MRKLLIIIAVIFQILLLGIMAAERECVLRTGKIVYLRTVPVDPRDYFRGDYVRLRYKISHINFDKLRDGLKNLNQDRDEKDKKVYVVLEVDDQNVANVVYASDVKPEKGELFIRGRLDYKGDGGIDVRYGIESYFVEQNQGKELEIREVNSNGSTLEMATALGNNGIAVIKDYRWINISTEVEDFDLEQR
ncbi:MAG TPA: GDYXXLXY domain-containing protein [Sedimentisphaerales bacterium]|nr:GDYXXLXY domain-containing protein [Sedimentisphaerales bacterium]